MKEKTITQCTHVGVITISHHTTTSFNEYKSASFKLISEKHIKGILNLIHPKQNS
jgi:hypothetical protein